MKVKKCGHAFDVPANFLNKAPYTHAVECTSAVFSACFRKVARVLGTYPYFMLLFTYTWPLLVIKKMINVSSKELRTLVSDVTVVSLDVDQVWDYCDPEQGRSWTDKLRFMFLFNSFFVYQTIRKKYWLSLLNPKRALLCRNLPYILWSNVHNRPALLVFRRITTSLPDS
jgi:hypothetical protein